MYKPQFRQKKRRKSRLIRAGILFIGFCSLLAAAGGVLYRLPVTLQDISRIIQVAAGKSSLQPVRKTAIEKWLRGTIYDRNFKEMAVSYPIFSLYIHPAKNNNYRQTVAQLASLLKISTKKLEQRFKAPERVVMLADDLDSRQIAAVKQLHLEGVFWKRNVVRYYPENEAAANVIGYTGNGVGLSGIERQYDVALQTRGYQPAELPEVDFAGNKVLGRKGTDLILTLDLQLQKKTDARLRELLRSRGEERGMALLLDPASGSVLAASIQPSFNPNYFWQTGAAGSHDRIFQQLFPLGCLRPLLARVAAIVAQGENDTPLLPETIAARNFGLSREQYDKIIRSLQIAAPVIDRLTPAADDKPAVVNGSQPYLSLMQIGVGLASFMNGGWRHAPVFLDSVYDVEKGRQFFLKKSAGNSVHILSPTMSVRIRRDLAARFSGSKKHKSLVFSAKDTHLEPAGSFSRYVRQQLFVGMIPENKPELLLVMAVEGGRLGPLVKQKKQTSMTRIGRVLLSALYATRASEQVAVYPGRKNEENFARFLIRRRMEYLPLAVTDRSDFPEMPRLLGMSLRKGLQQLNGRRLRIMIEGTGKIIAQTPAPGVRLKGVTSCSLRLQPEI